MVTWYGVEHHLKLFSDDVALSCEVKCIVLTALCYKILIMSVSWATNDYFI